MEKLFGTDGIRGIAGKDLTFDLAKKVGSALGMVLDENQCQNRKILIGMDTRISSPTLRDALKEGIINMGFDALDIGVCSTPAVAYLVKKHGYAAGVMISASHNPYIYNGIKMFGKDGFKICDEWECKIEDNIKNKTEKKNIPLGKYEYYAEGIREYIDYLVNSFGISLCGIKVGIDCANGSASVSAKEVFSRLGADCFVISSEHNGKNINDGCGSMHLDQLKSLVIREKLDLGLAFDGDGDRCIAIDENGREIDGDQIMAMLSIWMKENKELSHNTLVGTVMSNIGLVKFCNEHGINYVSTKVGDRFVLERLNEGNFSIGGEQSGHIILRKLATTGDGQLTAIAVLSRIKKSGKSLSTLADVMKKYPQYMTNIDALDFEKSLLHKDEKIQEMINEGSEKIGTEGRLLIRPSGTEPLIRIMAEGEDSERIKGICDDLSVKIKARLTELQSSVR